MFLGLGLYYYDLKCRNECTRTYGDYSDTRNPRERGELMSSETWKYLTAEADA
jgi:hypothetical protein